MSSESTRVEDEDKDAQAVPITDLIGRTLADIEINEDRSELVFMTKDAGSAWRMFSAETWHGNDVHISLEEVVGDLTDLIGLPILQAEEVSNLDLPPKVYPPDRHGRVSSDELYSWTFYKLATSAGYVTLRWYAGSNGHYSVGVDFHRVTTEELYRHDELAIK